MLQLVNYIRSAYIVIPPVKRIIVSILSCHHTIKRNLFSAAIAMFLAIINFSADAADQSIAIDYLHGEGDLSAIRLAYRPYHGQITQIQWLGDLTYIGNSVLISGNLALIISMTPTMHWLYRRSCQNNLRP
jgi:hypothetical protein